MPLAKGPRNLRHSLKWTPIDISAAFINEAKLVLTSASEGKASLASHLETISASPSAEEQIQAVKSMATYYSRHIKNPSSPEARFLVKLFASLVMQAQPNSPMQNALKKLLLSFDKTAHKYIADTLSASLRDVISSARDGEFFAVNCAINIIQECFNNFPLGVEAIDSLFHEVLRFLDSSLNGYVRELGREITPAERVRMYLFVHTACSTLLPLLQKCGNIDRDGSKDVLRGVLERCTLLAGDGEVSFDTRNNCGHIVVLLVAFMEGESGILKLVTMSSPSLPGAVPRLVVITGLLNALTSQQLCLSIPHTTNTVITNLLGELLAFSEKDNSDSTFVYGMARSMVLLWRNLCNMISNNEYQHSPAPVIRQTLPFVWIYLEHYMDSVKFSAHNVLQSLVTASLALNDRAIVETFIDQVVRISPDKRSRYSCIKLLAKLVGTLPLVDKIPGLVPSLITALEDMNLQTIACNTLDILLDRSHGEVDSYQWVREWINPIVLALSSSRNSTGSLEKLLASAFARSPSCLSLVTANQDNRTPLKVILACVKIARRQYGSQLRDIEGSSKSKRLWKGLVEYNTLQQALWHSDQEIRLSAFELIWDSRKVTELFTGPELSLLRTAVQYNMINENPTAKQVTPTQVKRTLHRLNASAQSLQRRVDIDPDTDDRDMLEAYSAFCSWLLRFCCASLFRGANFGRRSTSLEILACCVASLDADTLSRSLFSGDNATLLADCLEDNFENNKLLAHGILVKFPADVLRFNDPIVPKSWISVGLSLASSNRPPDCMTGGYILLTVTSFPQSSLALSKMTGCPETDPALLAVRLLTRQLSAELDIARDNLLLAAARGPMYGSLFCIRTLLENVDLSDPSKVAAWQLPIQSLVEMCYEMTLVASPIVNNSSPEGYVPMDLETVSSFDADGNETKATAQLVLLCAWRTVKETSLFLGYIAEKASIADDEASGILSESHLLAMGTHLIALLSEIKHRGAFEQGCVGFTQLCTRLWAHPTARLNMIPARWLHEILASVETGEKLCATRRGAGLPFMVQALIVTELTSGVPPQCVGPTMGTLLQLATKGSTLDIRTNALNVLRALVRHAQLGELVMPHVACCMEVALSGLKSNAWAERNSSTLLFSALMTRMFGVRRSKENRMTGYMFFLRYPRLHQVMLDELKTSEDMSTSERDSRYPALLILARLTPSPPGTSQSAPQVTVYVPLVRACATSPVFETRVLAAKALVPLITPDNYLCTLTELFDQVETAATANLRHGCLLQILHLLREVPSSLYGDKAMTRQMTAWMSQSLHVLVSINYLAMQVYVRVLGCFARHFDCVDKSHWDQVRLSLTEGLSAAVDPQRLPRVDYQLGRRVYCQSAAVLLLDISVASLQDSVVLTTLCDLLRHVHYEVVATGLDFLTRLFDRESDSDVFFASLNREAKRRLRGAVSSCEVLPGILLGYVERPLAHAGTRAQVFRALSCLSCSLLALRGSVQDSLLALLRLSRSERDHMSRHVVHCVSSFLREAVLSSLDADTWVQLGRMLQAMSSPDKPQANRFAAATVLVENQTMFHREDLTLPETAQCMIWTAAVSLLQDDDSNNRDLAASINSTTCDYPVTPGRALELLVEMFRRRAGSAMVRATCLLAWGLRGMWVSADADAQDCIFERGDANSYAEDVILTDLVCDQLGCDPSDSLTRQVDPGLMRWLVGETVGDLDSLPATLTGFLGAVQDKAAATSAELGYDVGSHKVASFLNPGHKTLQLDSYRLQRCLDAFNWATLEQSANNSGLPPPPNTFN